jgi:hypothetical protein
MAASPLEICERWKWPLAIPQQSLSDVLRVFHCLRLARSVPGVLSRQLDRLIVEGVPLYETP